MMAKKSKRQYKVAAFLLQAGGLGLLCLLASCGKGNFESGGQLATSKARIVPPNTGVSIAKRLVVPADKLTLRLGAAAKLPVALEYADGHSEDVSEKASYSIEQTAIASLAAGGVGTIVGEAVGKTQVQVAYEGLTISVAVEVLAYSVVRLSVTADANEIRVGDSGRIKVIGVLENQQTVDFTTQASYSSSDPLKIGISASEPGKVTGLDVGRDAKGAAVPSQVEVRVTFEGHAAKTMLTVMPYLQIADGEDVRTRIATPTQAGETSKNFLLTFLRPGEEVTQVTMGVHSVDLKLLRTTQQAPVEMGGQIGWYQQKIVLDIAAKWIGTDHTSEYRNQELKIQLKNRDGATRTVPVNLVWVTAAVGSEESESEPAALKVFSGREGDPSALPAGEL